MILSDFWGKQVFTQLIQFFLFYCIDLLYSILDETTKVASNILPTFSIFGYKGVVDLTFPQVLLLLLLLFLLWLLFSSPKRRGNVV